MVFTSPDIVTYYQMTHVKVIYNILSDMKISTAKYTNLK